MPLTDQARLSLLLALTSTPGTIRQWPARRSVPNQETTKATRSRFGHTAVNSSSYASQSVEAVSVLRFMIRALPSPVFSVTRSVA